LIEYDVKMHGRAELSQYEMLDFFVTHCINIKLYKDTIYILCSIWDIRAKR